MPLQFPYLNDYLRNKQVVQLIKTYTSEQAKQDLHNFYAGNVLHTFKREGLFEFLNQPRSVEEIAEKYQYTDKELLTIIIQLLTSEQALITVEDEDESSKTPHDGVKYQAAKEISDKWVLPKGITEDFKDVWINYSDALPNRLRGKYTQFTQGINLYNWDDALSSKPFEAFRRAAFLFAQAGTRRGKLLDVGCGNGWGTSDLWHQYYQQGCYAGENNLMQISAIDIDSKLLKIAQNDFSLMIAKRLNISKDEAEKFKPTFPGFQQASATKLPFPDKSFDLVFCSLVLIWTDTEKAVKEMVRVAKPDGIIFGIEPFFPYFDGFTNLHYVVHEGAKGCVTQMQFKKFALEAGAKKVSFITKLSVYKIEK